MSYLKTTAIQHLNGSSPNIYLNSNRQVSIGSSTFGNQYLTVRTSNGETGIGFTEESSGGKTYELITGGSGGAFAGGSFGVYDRTAGATRMLIDSSGRVSMPYQPIASVSHSAEVNLTEVQLNSSNFYDTIYVNNGSHFNASTGRFTCPIAGHYRLYFRCSTASDGTNVRLRKNGNGINEAYDQVTSGASSVSSEIVVYCSAGDYLDVQVNRLHPIAGPQHKQVTFMLIY